VLVSAGVFLLVLTVGFVLASLKSKPVQIAEILKNEQLFGTKRIEVQGNLVLTSSLNTNDGIVSFYSLKDKTGEIPISANTSGILSSDSIVELTVTVGQVCVEGRINPDNQTVSCEKRQLGLIEN